MHVYPQNLETLITKKMNDGRNSSPTKNLKLYINLEPYNKSKRSDTNCRSLSRES
ncbi:hypothetical protein HanXRQr2_Chr06g0269751 [Helianthus annuus]|uniref:Uncharacterized protein n=1 Tax=Helianthus annuus TaxID=4232 RepID=A0A9K3IUI0_HELAN|nr:hypothetical protein HanXRQr2_Chr06g0269751 [Helianthus annuus]KAJ0916330.1 hypothetical protein HanPSC8_Chr06g0260381 [Helianthus annuus]